MNIHMNELRLSCENGVYNMEWLDPNLIIIVEGL
jgi:hypothetical protein